MIRRIHKLHLSLELFIEAFTYEATYLGPLIPRTRGVAFEMHVRWWNPAAWVGWSRVVIFKDRCGAAYFRKKKC